MLQKQWLLAIPVFLLLGWGGHALVSPLESRGADRRVVDDQFLALEAKVGYHLYAPTWLPRGGKVGTIGAMQGAKRILQDFSDGEDRSLCILSQEPRTEERDEYHARIFKERAEVQAEVTPETKGYFVTGSSGERRLYWNQERMALILSSNSLTDEEMLQVARRIR
jgi:hypothetical protein